ncbi:MAG: toprim domain-containing protein, partial [Acidimicrobiales bacterium]
MTITETAPATAEPAVLDVAHCIGLDVVGDQHARRGVAMARCPFHEDGRASLVLASRINRWRCLAGCYGGAWQSPVALFTNRTGRPEADLEAMLGDIGAEPVERAIPALMPRSRTGEVVALEAVLSFICGREDLLRSGAGVTFGEVGSTWLSSRGLDPVAVAPFVYEVGADVVRVVRARFFDHVLERAGLMQRGRLCFGADREVMLVYRDGGGRPTWCQFVATSARAIARGPKYLGPIGVSPAPFVEGALGAARRVVICEGAVDALSLVVARTSEVRSSSLRRLVRTGRSVAVLGVPGALSFKAEWFADIAADAEILIATDPDDAGDVSARELVA